MDPAPGAVPSNIGTCAQSQQEKTNAVHGIGDFIAEGRGDEETCVRDNQVRDGLCRGYLNEHIR